MEVEIAVETDVYCEDGNCGIVKGIVLNPVTDQVTHIVVQTPGFPHGAYLVPFAKITVTTSEKVVLECTMEQLRKMPPFVREEFVHTKLPQYISDPYIIAWPYAIPREETVVIHHEHVPPGELDIKRGTSVEATDGPIGKVDEFLVDPADGDITHVILREGHLWGHKDVMIPISSIARIEEDTVYLTLDKDQVGALPEIPVAR